MIGPALRHELAASPAARHAVASWVASVVSVDGRQTPCGSSFLVLVEEACGASISSPEHDPAVVAAVAFTPAARCDLVELSIVAACVHGSVSDAAFASVRQLDRTLAVRSPWIPVLDAMRTRSELRLKLALASRAPDARRVLSRTWHEEGVLGLLRAGLFVAGAYRDADLARRFRAFETLPDTSFGRAFFEHMHARGLAFPGERGGVPLRMVHHDLMHVLCGYDTDAAGECELAGVYAALCGREGFAFLAIALSTFHLGLRVSPAAVKPTQGCFDPLRVARAFERGRGIRVDVTGDWDFWSLAPLPLGEVRERLGLGGPGV